MEGASASLACERVAIAWPSDRQLIFVVDHNLPFACQCANAPIATLRCGFESSSAPPLVALEQLAREIEKMEGVSGMWSAGDYPALGLPAPADHPQVADVMFEAAPGYSFGDADAGDDEHGAPKYLGTHGQRPTYADNAAFFLATGAGIAVGSGAYCSCGGTA